MEEDRLDRARTPAAVHGPNNAAAAAALALASASVTADGATAALAAATTHHAAAEHADGGGGGGGGAAASSSSSSSATAAGGGGPGGSGGDPNEEATIRVRCEDGDVLWLTLKASDPMRRVSEAVEAHRGGASAGPFALRVPFPPVEYATPEQLDTTTLRRARLVPRGALIVLPDRDRGVVRQASAELRRQARAHAQQAAAAMAPDDDGMQQAMQQMLQQMADMGPGGDMAGLMGGMGGGGGGMGGGANGDYEALLQMEEAMGGAVAHGLSAGELSSLSVRTLDEDEASAASGRCCICCCEWVAGDRLMRLHCQHEFHLECIGTWLRAKRVCPICKGNAVGGNPGAGQSSCSHD